MNAPDVPISILAAEVVIPVVYSSPPKWVPPNVSENLSWKLEIAVTLYNDSSDKSNLTVSPSNKTNAGCVSLLNVNEYVIKSAFWTALTKNVMVCDAGVNVPVPLSIIPSPSSKSCSVSKRIPSGIFISVACSNSIPSLLFEPSLSCSILITSAKLVSSSWVEVLNPLTVPVWLVKVLPAAKVPVTSLRTKWAVGSNSGGFIVLYLRPPSVILNDLAAPISFVVAISFAPVPDVVSVTATVGSFV